MIQLPEFRAEIPADLGQTAIVVTATSAFMGWILRFWVRRAVRKYDGMEKAIADFPKDYVSRNELQAHLDDIHKMLDRNMDDRHRQNEIVLAAIERMRLEQRSDIAALRTEIQHTHQRVDNLMRTAR